MSTEDAELLVERQAQAFERAKPYLVDGWRRAAKVPMAAKTA
jgi:hypothetical protein